LWRASHDENTYMRDQFKKKQCCFTCKAKRFIVASIVASPKLSGAAIEVLMHGIARSILEVLNIEYTEDTILNILPCKRQLKDGLRSLLALYCMFALQDWTKKMELVLTC
jgi:hypothetical protein